MRQLIFFVLFLLITANAARASWHSLRCDFSISGAPFATIEFAYSDTGELSEFAKVTHYGQTHREPLAARERGPDQLVNAVVNPGESNQWLELLVFQNLSARLVNPHVPPGFREMGGTCTLANVY